MLRYSAVCWHRLFLCFSSGTAPMKISRKMTLPTHEGTSQLDSEPKKTSRPFASMAICSVYNVHFLKSPYLEETSLNSSEITETSMSPQQQAMDTSGPEVFLVTLNPARSQKLGIKLGCSLSVHCHNHSHSLSFSCRHCSGGTERSYCRWWARTRRRHKPTLQSSRSVCG